MGGIEGVRRSNLCIGLTSRLSNIEHFADRSTAHFDNRGYWRRLRLVPPAAAIIVVVNPGVTMATPDIRAAYYVANNAADDCTRKPRDDRAATGADYDAFPRSGLGRERHGGQRYREERSLKHKSYGEATLFLEEKNQLFAISSAAEATFGFAKSSMKAMRAATPLELDF
jgi:hypothetical protein